MKILKQPVCILKKSVFLLFAGILLGGTLLSQVSKIDIITLKSGSIIKGRLIEMTDSTKVSIETLCQNIWVFSLDEIDKIESELVKTHDPAPVAAGETPRSIAREKGYYNISSPGILISSGNNDKNTIFSFQIINGYQYHSRYYAGFGTGLEFFEYTHLPLFLEGQYRLLDRNVSPYITVKGGYSVMLDHPDSDDWVSYQGKGGYLYGAGMGIIMPFGKKNALTISFLYRHQDATIIYTTRWNDQTTKITTEYDRLSFRVGLMFY